MKMKGFKFNLEFVLKASGLEYLDQTKNSNNIFSRCCGGSSKRKSMRMGREVG
jgi:hypothetical protein